MNNLEQKYATPDLSKVCIVLRGCAGASKSTLAEYVKNLYDNYFIMYNAIYLNKLNGSKSVVCTADDHFISKDNNYNFIPSELGAAHAKCKEKFLNALKDNVGLVICANTNSSPSEYGFYVDAAKNCGYTVFSLVVEKRFDGGDNGHNCPEKSLSKQEQNIKQSLKLR